MNWFSKLFATKQERAQDDLRKLREEIDEMRDEISQERKAIETERRKLAMEKAMRGRPLDFGSFYDHVGFGSGSTPRSRRSVFDNYEEIFKDFDDIFKNPDLRVEETYADSMTKSERERVIKTLELVLKSMKAKRDEAGRRGIEAGRRGIEAGRRGIEAGGEVMDYIEVQAGVRFWEDAEVNGVEDTNGDLIPLREGDYWCPVIRIRDGAVMGWPQGVRASIHYKVCDEGQYWLLDCNRRRVSKYKGYYVPAVLSPSADPDGDYIVMEIDDNGMISEWDPDALDVSGWEPCDA